jgi:hypothetical protein
VLDVSILAMLSLPSKTSLPPTEKRLPQVQKPGFPMNGNVHRFILANAKPPDSLRDRKYSDINLFFQNLKRPDWF